MPNVFLSVQLIEMSNSLCRSIVKSSGYYNAYKETEPYDPNYSYNIGLTALVGSQKGTDKLTKTL